MSSIIGRAAFRATRPLRYTPTRPLRFPSGVNAGSLRDDVRQQGEQNKAKEALKRGASRDPELIVLLGIMTFAYFLVGWHFSRSPTSSSSENPVAKVQNSEPWKDNGSESGAMYQYHPDGDESKGKRDAPSALNTVIIPNVNLPKRLHDTYNKYGKEEWEY